jgi:hypothetical protein
MSLMWYTDWEAITADALSRGLHLIEDPTLELDILLGEKFGAMICSLQSEEAWTMELVCEGQEQDEELSEVRKWVLDILGE